jgi:hypothetical protein
MKQTAVEWLENYIDKEINKYSRQPMDLNAIHALNHIKHYTCKQAKEMEKQQRQKDFKAGNECACMCHENIEDYFKQYIKSE